MLIVLLIGKRYNCPLSKAKNIFWWNRFHALSSYWTGQIWGWNPTAHCRWIPPTVQEPFTFPLTLIPWKTQLPESHHLKYQRPGSKKHFSSILAVQCSAVCEIECDACLASVCICGSVNEATVTCLLLAVWLIILWGLLLPHGARPVWACGRPGKRASSISPLHRRS